MNAPGKAASPPRPQQSAVATAIELLRAGRQAEAFEAFRRIVAVLPGNPAVVNAFATALVTAGDTAEAAAVLAAYLATRPADVLLALRLAERIGQIGDRVGALGVFRSAAAVQPDDADIQNRIGNLLMGLGRTEEALAAFDALLQAHPAYAYAHCNRGLALSRLGDKEGAFAAYRRAVELDPACISAFINIAAYHADQDDHAGAIAAYERAIAIDPDHVVVLFELCNQRRYACDWDGLAERQAHLDAVLPESGVRVAPFPRLFASTTPAEQRRAAEVWTRGLRIAPSDRLPPSPRVPEPGARIRIGYVSGDFYQHATAILVAELFERHDRSRFELFAYSFRRSDGSALRQRLEAAVEHFLDVDAMTDREVAQRIRADGIDILVDLKGYSRGARAEIMAMRPAPVQVNYLTYPATMGADFMDYIVVDAAIAPAEHQPFYPERLVHLPDCYQPIDTTRTLLPPPSRAACGLPEDGFVFCCFNNNYKITPEIFAVWMRLLHAVPDAVLWLLDGNALARENLKREAARSGIDADRLVFAPRLVPEQHIARYQQADLFLDTLPVNAHTTASDSLWGGTPVVTCMGDSLVARVAGSILDAAGLPELVTRSLADYEALALALAQDRGRLAAMRAKLAANKATAPLFDTARYCRHLEAAFERMHARRLAGLAPEPFAVAPIEATAPRKAASTQFPATDGSQQEIGLGNQQPQRTGAMPAGLDLGQFADALQELDGRSYADALRILQQAETFVAEAPSRKAGRALIFMTARDCEMYVERAIQSLARQDYDDLHVLFVDDFSQDDTGLIARRLLGDLFPGRHSFIRNEERFGKAHAASMHLRPLAREAEFVAVVDGDDELVDPLIVRRMAKSYRDGKDVVWTNFVTDDGHVGANAMLDPGRHPRSQGWKTSHFFSFRAELLETVPESYFRDGSGAWLMAACDIALAMPMLDQTRRYEFIPVNAYRYTATNPNSHHNLDPNSVGINSTAQQNASREVMGKPPLPLIRPLVAEQRAPSPPAQAAAPRLAVAPQAEAAKAEIPVKAPMRSDAWSSFAGELLSADCPSLLDALAVAGENPLAPLQIWALRRLAAQAQPKPKLLHVGAPPSAVVLAALAAGLACELDCLCGSAAEAAELRTRLLAAGLQNGVAIHAAGTITLTAGTISGAFPDPDVLGERGSFNAVVVDMTSADMRHLSAAIALPALAGRLAPDGFGFALLGQDAAAEQFAAEQWAALSNGLNICLGAVGGSGVMAIAGR